MLLRCTAAAAVIEPPVGRRHRPFLAFFSDGEELAVLRERKFVLPYGNYPNDWEGFLVIFREAQAACLCFNCLLFPDSSENGRPFARIYTDGGFHSAQSFGMNVALP